MFCFESEKLLTHQIKHTEPISILQVQANTCIANVTDGNSKP